MLLNKLTFKNDSEKELLIDYYIKVMPMTSQPYRYVRIDAQKELQIMELADPVKYNNFLYQAVIDKFNMLTEDTCK